jgi:hypothetical protein
MVHKFGDFRQISVQRNGPGPDLAMAVGMQVSLILSQ